MSIPFRTKNGGVMYIAMSIGCKDISQESDDEGVVLNLHCTSKILKPECEECSLINQTQPNYKPGSCLQWCLEDEDVSSN